MGFFERFFGQFRKSSSVATVSDDQSLQAAISLHQAGKLNEAEVLYRRVLEHDKRNASVLRLLGVIAQQRGNNGEALGLIGQAIAQGPTDPVAYNSLGGVLRSMGELDAARQAFDHALELKPDYAEVLNSRGCLFQRQGKIELAAKDFTSAVQINPEYVEAIYNLGNILRERGDLDQAENCYLRALALRPGLAEACKNLGSLYQECDQVEQAESFFRQALALRPDYAEANNDYGTLLLGQGRMSEAESRFRLAIDANPQLAEAHNNLGDLLNQQNRLDEAQGCIMRALSIQPDFARALTNLGLLHLKRGGSQEAEMLLRQALALQPGLANAHNIFGLWYSEQGQLAEAETCFRKALALDPRNAASKFSLGSLMLLRGHYDEGLALYESRFRIPISQLNGSLSLAAMQEYPRWQGEDMAGQRLLVWTEQGFGDSLMMMRYLPLLRQRGVGQVIIYCEPALKRLMQDLPGVDQVIPSTQQITTQFDLHCPMMSLPHLFHTRLDSIPGQHPYLSVPDTLVMDWAKQLNLAVPAAATRVGLVWAGSSALSADAKRSISLRLFAPLLELQEIQLISLQKGKESRQLAELGWNIPDWMDRCEDFMDTAALVQNLDLVIAVDTAVLHLAGALGKQAWLLNRFESEWRWGIDRECSPWYPSIRIFRQARRGDWESVIRRVAQAVKELPPRTSRKPG